ncbi:MAG: hypothetical protein SNJ75_15390 [Gemmataceae bacterium]
MSPFTLGVTCGLLGDGFGLLPNVCWLELLGCVPFIDEGLVLPTIAGVVILPSPGLVLMRLGESAGRVWIDEGAGRVWIGEGGSGVLGRSFGELTEPVRGATLGLGLGRLTGPRPGLASAIRTKLLKAIREMA